MIQSIPRRKRRGKGRSLASLQSWLRRRLSAPPRRSLLSRSPCRASVWSSPSSLGLHSDAGSSTTIPDGCCQKPFPGPRSWHTRVYSTRCSVLGSDAGWRCGQRRIVLSPFLFLLWIDDFIHLFMHSFIHSFIHRLLFSPTTCDFGPRNCLFLVNLV